MSRRVTPATRYAPDPGYGWLADAEVDARDRRQGDAIDRDLNLTSKAVFRVDLPDGLYGVSVRVGDTVDHGPSLVAVEERLVGPVRSRGAGVFETLSTEVRVLDGHLDVEIAQTATAGEKRPGGEAIINGLSIERRELPPDPVRWERHSPEIELRRVTDAERIANRWPAAAWLVHGAADVVRDDRAEARLALPDGEGGVFDLTLPFAGPGPELSIVELGFGVPTSGGRYAMRRYAAPSSGEAQPGGLLIADPVRGGFWASVVPPGSTGSLEVRSGEPGWQIAPIALGDGSLPGGQQLYLVSPGPGPVGIGVPPPPGAYGFAVVGEIKWCTASPGGWAAELAGRALYAVEGFAACPEGFGINGQCVHSTDVELVQRALFCNVTSSQQVAGDCAQGDGCPSNEFGHEYSYLGCGTEAACYMSRVLDNLQQARDEGHFVPGLHLAQVVHDGPLVLIVPGVPDDTLVTICGLAALPSSVACEGGTEDWPAGVSAAATNDPQCPFVTTTHELGHNFGALHEAANSSYGGGGCTGTVLEWDEGRCNLFSIDNAATLADCALDDETLLGYASDDWCPPVTEVAAADCPHPGGGLLLPPP